MAAPLLPARTEAVAPSIYSTSPRRDEITKIYRTMPSIPVLPMCITQGVTLTNLVVTSEAETAAGPSIVRSALPLWLASFNR